MSRKKNRTSRREGALNRLLQVANPDDRQLKEIEVLKKRVAQ